jgi:hypothetical protein
MKESGPFLLKLAHGFTISKQNFRDTLFRRYLTPQKEMLLEIIS